MKEVDNTMSQDQLNSSQILELEIENLTVTKEFSLLNFGESFGIEEFLTPEDLQEKSISREAFSGSDKTLVVKLEYSQFLIALEKIKYKQRLDIIDFISKIPFFSQYS